MFAEQLTNVNEKSDCSGYVLHASDFESTLKFSTTDSNAQGDTMDTKQRNYQIAMASLAGLLTLTAIQLMALFAGVKPHPPEFVGPFLGTVLSIGIVCTVLVYGKSKIGNAFSLVFSIANIPNVGLHKLWSHPDANILWPVVILGSLLVLTLFVSSIRLLKTN